MKENFHMFGNGHRENLIFTLDAGESVTCHFNDSGTDTATDKYFDIKQFAHKVAITVNKAASITKIQNQTLKSPRTLGSAAMNTFSEGIEWGKITLRADQDTTVFEVYAS